jgi:hypothetical protein
MKRIAFEVIMTVLCVCLLARTHVHIHLFKLLKQLTNFNEIWYAEYAAQGHHSTTHVNILQSVISNNMPGEQTNEVEMALASLILGSRTEIW